MSEAQNPDELGGGGEDRGGHFIQVPGQGWIWISGRLSTCTRQAQAQKIRSEAGRGLPGGRASGQRWSPGLASWSWKLKGAFLQTFLPVSPALCKEVHTSTRRSLLVHTMVHPLIHQSQFRHNPHSTPRSGYN